MKSSAQNTPADNRETKSTLGGSFRFNSKRKGVIAVALIAIVLVSCFIFFPKGEPTSDTPGQTTEPIATTNVTHGPTSNPTYINGPPTAPFNPFGASAVGVGPIPKDKSTEVVTNAQSLNSSVWKQVAGYAWNFFQPGVGVDSKSGLPASGDAVNYFTDWDLGVYLQAVIDAQKIGLITTDGAWGSSNRINKVMTFLENRELNNSSYPYWFYNTDGTVNHELSDSATEACNSADTGRLLVALNNLKAFNSSISSRVDNFVYNTYGNRSNYSLLVPGFKAESVSSTDMYAYYIISGFASFWPAQLKDAPARILNNILASPTVKTPENITLPNARLLEDPILCSIFELSNNPAQLTALANQMYLAHEAYYNSTGQYRAFGEGNTFTSAWVYEWVVCDGKTWDVKDFYGDTNISPIVYTKISFSFLAIYNTTFAKNMVMYIEDKMDNPDRGYSNGVNEAGETLTSTGIHTNGLILSAVRYAIQKNP